MIFTVFNYQLLLFVNSIPINQSPLQLQFYSTSKSISIHPTDQTTTDFLFYAETELARLQKNVEESNWGYETNITQANSLKITEATLKYNEALLHIIRKSKSFQPKNPIDERKLHLLSLLGGVPKNTEAQRQLKAVEAKLLDIYSTSTWNGQQLEPHLTETLRKSRNPDDLEDAYIGWRNVTGPRMKSLYQDYVRLLNEGARDGGFEHASHLWRSAYDMHHDDFSVMMEKIWKQVLPLYKQLHCYTRTKLRQRYGSKVVPKGDGTIPGHLFGNMWSQDWINIYDLVVPYPETTALEVTSALVEQKYTPYRMHKMSESFYESLGYPPLPASFWQKSMIERPKDREVVCHASATDYWNDDLRIKMCTAITEVDLYTVHHEQGHLYYDHHYKDQPFLFRDSAADFFHEAIGDTMVLSVSTPKHLEKVGLLKGPVSNSYKQTINAQMSTALAKIAILPYSYLIDLWRWKVFDGSIKPEDYQSSWETLVEKYQGIKRPIPSNENDFDPGCKFHVPGNTPYVRYFGAAVIQFQFHEGLCNVINHQGPIHECDIYENKDAGARFSEMLRMGKSERWQEALNVAMGKPTELSGSSLMKYFEPLMKWLEEQNKDEVCGWDQENIQI
ncbi:hypothetical protein BC833DRAFT_606398 [Globomyces pollinis-pini]|nr:hypothetical protein BC833DRAFT_606398 [Globomyces pollinis-pini]